MAECPKCGEPLVGNHKKCEICGFELNSREANSANESVEWEQSKDDENNNDKEEEKRQLWIKQQQALKDELSGLKSSLKEESNKEEKPDLPVSAPLPVQYYYPPKANVGYIGRNVSGIGLPVTSIYQPEYLQPKEISEDDKESDSEENKEEDIPEAISVNEQEDIQPPAETMEAEPAQEKKRKEKKEFKKARAAVSSKKVNGKQKDVIRVDSILQEGEDETIERRNFNISGAIDKIMNHEKTQKTKVMKMKLSTPGPMQGLSRVTPETSKKYQVEEIIKYLEIEINKCSEDFNALPIRKLISKSLSKLAEKDYNSSYSLAVNAEKTFKRSIEHFKTATNRIKFIEEKYSVVLEADHKLHNKYKNILADMNSGQYFKAIQHLKELRDEFERGTDSQGYDEKGIEGHIEMQQPDISKDARKEHEQSSSSEDEDYRIKTESVEKPTEGESSEADAGYREHIDNRFKEDRHKRVSRWKKRKKGRKKRKFR